MTKLMDPNNPPVEQVYFFKENATNAIKIGRSYDVRMRFEQIQSGMPQELEFLGFMQGSWAKEKEMHSKFEHLRLRGEWFRFDQSIVDFIESNTNQVMPPAPPTIKKPKKRHGSYFRKQTV